MQGMQETGSTLQVLSTSEKTVRAEGRGRGGFFLFVQTECVEMLWHLIQKTILRLLVPFFRPPP